MELLRADLMTAEADRVTLRRELSRLQERSDT